MSSLTRPIVIDHELHARFKSYCGRSQASIKDVAEKLLEAFLTDPELFMKQVEMINLYHNQSKTIKNV